MAVPETGPLEGMQPIRYAEACLKAMRDANRIMTTKHMALKPAARE